MNKYQLDLNVYEQEQRKKPNKQNQLTRFSNKFKINQLFNPARSISATLPDPNMATYYSSHNSIVKKQRLLRPTSFQRHNQRKKFTKKCLQLLSSKKQIITFQDKQQRQQNKQRGFSRVRIIMHNMTQKYKKIISQQKQHTQKKPFSNDKILTQQRTIVARSQLTNYQQKIQTYKLIRSSDLTQQNTKQFSTTFKEDKQSKKKHQIIKIKINNLIKFNQQHVTGVQCFSLLLNQPVNTKMHPAFMQRNPQETQHIEQPKPIISRKKLPPAPAKLTHLNYHKFIQNNYNTQIDIHYMKKLKSFLDFIFKINYSNNIYVHLQLSQDIINIKKYKIYIGKGNNSLLIKSLIQRRFWLDIVDHIDQEGILFYWSQNKIDKLHNKQTLSKTNKSKKQAKQILHPKKKQLKEPQEKQLLQLNKKILPVQQINNVQQYIGKNGHFQHQQQKYTFNLITNHLPKNSCIGSKKNLFKSLLHYYRDYLKINPFDYIPLTYNVKGVQDGQFHKFLQQQKDNLKKIWIIKPGQNTNRGTGIKLAQTSKIIDIINKKQKHANGQNKTYIIQSYIDKPFLYNNRKFDIRHYMLITSVNGIIKAYWYKQGYLRTSSQIYSLNNLTNQKIHLTNDAIQKKYQQYQKFEPGNKLSYPQFQRYLDSNYPNKGYNFERDIVLKMKSTILDVIKANYNIIDKSRRQCNFEIFGFDFLIDRDFKPWLIQINYNPCLQINCPVLSRIIPRMIQNSLRIGLDPLLPPLNHYPGTRRFNLTDNFLKSLKYQLIFDQLTFQENIPILYDIGDSDDQQKQYHDEGKEIQQFIL